MQELESGSTEGTGSSAHSGISIGSSHDRSDRRLRSRPGGAEVTIVTLNESFVFELRPRELVRDLKKRIYAYLRRNSEESQGRMRLIYLGKLLEDNAIVERVVRPHSTVHCVINAAAVEETRREEENPQLVDDTDFIVDITDVPEDFGSSYIPSGREDLEAEDTYSCQLFVFGVFLGFELVGLLIRLTSPSLKKEIKAGINVGLALRLAFTILQSLLGWKSDESNSHFAVENEMFRPIS